MKMILTIFSIIFITLTSLILLAEEPFYGGQAIKEGFLDYERALQESQARYIERLKNSPPITVIPGSTRTIFHYFYYSPYYYPYYPYYNGLTGYGYNYPNESTINSNTTNVYNSPTYSQEKTAPAPEAQEYQEYKETAADRADKYISDLTNENPAVRKVAVMMLAELKAKEAESVIIDLMLNDKDAGVRKAAAEALGDIGSIKAIEPLYKAKKDKDEEVKKAASISLGKLRKLWAR